MLHSSLENILEKSFITKWHLGKAIHPAVLGEENGGGGRDNLGQCCSWLIHARLSRTTMGVTKHVKGTQSARVGHLTLFQKWTMDPWRLNYAWYHSQEKEDGKGRIKRLTMIFFFWSQFIFLWAKSVLPQGWHKAAFPGSHIYHTKEKHHEGDSMINTWFGDPRIECPEMRIRIYLLEAWALAQIIFSAKFASKYPNLLIGLRH